MTITKYRATFALFSIAVLALLAYAVHREYRRRYPNTFTCSQYGRICELKDDQVADTFHQDTAYCRWVKDARHGEELLCTATLLDCERLEGPVAHEYCRHYTPGQIPDSRFRLRQ